MRIEDSFMVYYLQQNVTFTDDKLTIMRKIYCPQCSIANLYVKNSQGKQRIVFVTSDYTVVAAKEGESLDGFNIELIYCLGCSWSGTPKELKKHQS